MYTVYIQELKQGNAHCCLVSLTCVRGRQVLCGVPRGLNELANCGTRFMKQGDTQIGLTENI